MEQVKSMFSFWIAVIMIFFALPSVGQTQQGVVKTRGRMVNGKLVPGVGLPGTTVQLNDRSVVSNGTKGAFSFPARGKSYLVKSVTKKGYQLVDQEACRNYKYSADTLYLAMETPEQQQADLLAAERKIRRNLQRQLQQKEDEIEAMAASNAVKDSLLRILYQQQGDNEKIIADMAKRYAALDYDQLDEFYRQVNDLIENGELIRADSLLRSRGDLQQQVEQQLQAGLAIKAEEEKVQNDRQMHTQVNDELARRCYAYYESFQQQHMPDSAVHYLELRAALDTTNVEWQNETGSYISNYIGDYPKALTYFQLVLRQSLRQYGEENEWTATSYNNIGYVYDRQGDYSKALEQYFKSLAINKNVFGPEHPYVATSYNNIGCVYANQGDYGKALEYYSKALVIWERVLGTEHPKVALSYSNIGSVYYGQGDYPKALEYHFKALAIREKVLGAEHPDVATSYNNIGYVYDSQGDYSKALEFHFKALAIFEKVLGAEHPDVATSYNNIGLVYNRQGNYFKALEYYFMALAIYEKVLGAEHPYVATSYDNIASVYNSQGNYSNALEYHFMALAIYEKVLGAEHPDIATSYNDIGIVYYNQSDYPKALEYYFMALAIYEKVLGAEHPDIATSYNNIGAVYVHQGDYSKALEYFFKALAIREKVFGPEHQYTKSVSEKILNVTYKMSLSSGGVQNFLSTHAFTATIIDADTPAQQQGLNGEYILLEFADWTQDSVISLFDKNDEMRGKPKDIVVLKDGVIRQYHFENTIGAMLGIKEVTTEERLRINEIYDRWKKEYRK